MEQMGKFDWFCAFDVLEHLDRPEIGRVLTNAFRLSEKGMIFTIGTKTCQKKIDGKTVELHKTIEPMQWWMGFIRGFAKGDISIENPDNSNLLIVRHADNRTG